MRTSRRRLLKWTKVNSSKTKNPKIILSSLRIAVSYLGKKLSSSARLAISFSIIQKSTQSTKKLSFTRSIRKLMISSSPWKKRPKMHFNWPRKRKKLKHFNKHSSKVLQPKVVSLAAWFVTSKSKIQKIWACTTFVSIEGWASLMSQIRSSKSLWTNFLT